MNRRDQAFFENIVDGDWLESCKSLWEVLTGVLLDTRTPLERMARVTRKLKASPPNDTFPPPVTKCTFGSSLLDFRVLRFHAKNSGAGYVAAILKDAGYPWYNQKSKCFDQDIEFRLEEATYEQMMTIRGIGPKLASLWMRIVHEEERAVIDVHVYRWLTEVRGYKVPLANYDALSELMKREAASRGMTLFDLDRLLVENGIRKRRGLSVAPVPEIIP